MLRESAAEHASQWSAILHAMPSTRDVVDPQPAAAP